jgi:Na+/phosphate symporter
MAELMFFQSARLDKIVTVLNRIDRRCTWLMQQQAKQMELDAMQFNSIWVAIQDLKADVVRLIAKHEEAVAKLAECLKQEHIDPESVQAVHDELAALSREVEAKLHADGM